MTKLSTLLMATVAILTQSVSAKFSLGFCDSPALQPNFNVNSYLGPWHEHARDKGILFEYGDCVQAGYTKRSDGLIEVHNS